MRTLGSGSPIPRARCWSSCAPHSPIWNSASRTGSRRSNEPCPKGPARQRQASLRTRDFAEPALQRTDNTKGIETLLFEDPDLLHHPPRRHAPGNEAENRAERPEEFAADGAGNRAHNEADE